MTFTIFVFSLCDKLLAVVATLFLREHLSLPFTWWDFFKVQILPYVIPLKTVRVDLLHAIVDVHAVWYTVWHGVPNFWRLMQDLTHRTSLCCPLVVTGINVKILNWGWFSVLCWTILCLSETLVGLQMALLNDNCQNIYLIYKHS